MVEHRVETTDGLGLHVVEDGPLDGEAVVLVHGWPDTHRVWRHQVPALTRLGYRTIVYDQRGFGQSDRPTEVAGCHVFNAMADITSILDTLSIDRAHLVGHDWGAPPCWLAAAFAPERVRTLVAISVGHPQAFRSAGLEQKEKSFYMLLFQFTDVAEQWLSDNDWANMKMLIRNPRDWSDRRAELEKPGALTASLNWYRANMSPESLVEAPISLPPVTVPTMGIMGADDWALTETQMIASASYVDAEFRYEVVADSHHWCQTEKPGTVNGLLESWFATHA